MKIETSFGIIPLRPNIEGEGWEVFIVKHQKGHWAFPKGHSEEGEMAQQTAARELQEETGLTVSQFLNFPPLQENYTFKKEEESIDKTVTYYLAEVEGKIKLQDEEISDSGWYSFPAAEERLTFKEIRSLFSRVEELLFSQE